MNAGVRPWLVLAPLFGAAALVHAADTMPPPPVDNDTSPYHLAELAYHGGRYDAALASVNEAEKAKPGDPAVEVLKARILTEQHDFAAGEALLQKLVAAGAGYDAQIALGDIYLRARNYSDATKTYSFCLAQKPGNPDILLDLIYSLIGSGDYVTAGKYYSQLRPLDPDYPSYYFAKSALAQATGKSSELDEDMETVRTIYGLTTANRYLRTYLQVFAPDAENANRALPPPTNAPPATSSSGSN